MAGYKRVVMLDPRQVNKGEYEEARDAFVAEGYLVIGVPAEAVSLIPEDLQRDNFANCAMNALLMRGQPVNNTEEALVEFRAEIAEEAYALADAMILAREKKAEPVQPTVVEKVEPVAGLNSYAEQRILEELNVAKVEIVNSEEGFTKRVQVIGFNGATFILDWDKGQSLDGLIEKFKNLIVTQRVDEVPFAKGMH